MVRRSFRGFSLIEAAIVLGVVGLVIGGIWTAASAISVKQRVNDFLQVHSAALDLAQRLRRTAGSNEDITAILARRNVSGAYKLTVESDIPLLRSGKIAVNYSISNGLLHVGLQFGRWAGDDAGASPKECIAIASEFLRMRGKSPNFDLWFFQYMFIEGLDGGGYAYSGWGTTYHATSATTVNNVASYCNTSGYIDLVLDL